MKINKEILLKKLHWDKEHKEVRGYIQNDEYLFFMQNKLCDIEFEYMSQKKEQINKGNIYSLWYDIKVESNKQKEFFKKVFDRDLCKNNILQIL